MKQVYNIFAGKKTGKGSRDSQGFSTNGSFFGYVEENEAQAVSNFKKEHKNYNIYQILKKPSKK